MAYQGFSNVVFSDRTARLRAVREEGAGGGLRPPPAPSSPCERLWREESKRAATFEKPCMAYEMALEEAPQFLSYQLSSYVCSSALSAMIYIRIYKLSTRLQ